MKSRKIYLLSLGAVLTILVTGCSDDVSIDTTPIDTLESAIRAVGYSCAGVVDSSRLADELSVWRLKCQDALVYTTNLSSDGRICVLPMAYVDSVIPAGLTDGVNRVAERCVSPGDI
jgi:hypothetical protein